MNVRALLTESAVIVVLTLLVPPVCHENLGVHKELRLCLRVRLAHVLVVRRGEDRVRNVQNSPVNCRGKDVSLFALYDPSLLWVERKAGDIFNYLERCHLWEFYSVYIYIYFHTHAFYVL